MLCFSSGILIVKPQADFVETKKLPQPIAICTECGECTSRLDLVNERCFKEYGGRCCEGVFANALADHDWKECPMCKRTGWMLGAVCSHCKGWGWEFVRDRRGRRVETITRKQR